MLGKLFYGESPILLCQKYIPFRKKIFTEYCQNMYNNEYLLKCKVNTIKILIAKCTFSNA